jgi:3-oxoacyl-[acyl-carrier-protein] synthase III
MSSITDYTDRTTCPLFGDGAAAVLLEPTEEKIGVMDVLLRTDGVGYPHLYMKAGGSAIRLLSKRLKIESILCIKKDNPCLNMPLPIWPIFRLR